MFSHTLHLHSYKLQLFTAVFLLLNTAAETWRVRVKQEEAAFVDICFDIFLQPHESLHNS